VDENDLKANKLLHALEIAHGRSVARRAPEKRQKSSPSEPREDERSQEEDTAILIILHGTCFSLEGGVVASMYYHYVLSCQPCTNLR
jgi:hypothetical protein